MSPSASPAYKPTEAAIADCFSQVGPSATSDYLALYIAMLTYSNTPGAVWPHVLYNSTNTLMFTGKVVDTAGASSTTFITTFLHFPSGTYFIDGTAENSFSSASPSDILGVTDYTFTGGLFTDTVSFKSSSNLVGSTNTVNYCFVNGYSYDPINYKYK